MRKQPRSLPRPRLLVRRRGSGRQRGAPGAEGAASVAGRVERIALVWSVCSGVVDYRRSQPGARRCSPRRWLCRRARALRLTAAAGGISRVPRDGPRPCLRTAQRARLVHGFVGFVQASCTCRAWARLLGSVPFSRSAFTWRGRPRAAVSGTHERGRERRRRRQRRGGGGGGWLEATSSTCPLRAASMSLVTSATTVEGLSAPERGQALACSDSRAVPAVSVKRGGCVPQFWGGRGAEGVGAFCILLSLHGPAAPTLPSH